MTPVSGSAARPGLYLHIPFCSAVCPYCDFSVLKAGREARRRFVEHLLGEVPLAGAAWPDPRPFDTVYCGGGTPSQLPADDLARVLDACRTHLRLADPWVFLEVNPEDVDAASCAAWRELGVRTLSLGVQSFSDESLRFLGRRHSAAQARRAVDVALAAGFATISIDLIFGLPGQSSALWRRDLETAVAAAPHHVSCYQLTIYERTRFGVAARRGQLVELPEAQQAELFQQTHRFLAGAGYVAYEVSNFARSVEHESRHNRKYWDHTPYLGLGPSAHSFALAARAGTGGADDASAGTLARRWWNELRTPRWEGRIAAGQRPVEAEEALAARELATEAILLGLRTASGIDLDGLAAHYGVDLLAANRSLVAHGLDQGLLVLVGEPGRHHRLTPTPQGMAVADGLAAAFDVSVPL